MAIAKGIRRASMQKSRASIEYIKTRIRNVYKGLIWKLRPPEDWKERLRNEESDWIDLYERIWDVRNGVRELENILDKYHYLGDEELTNDVLEIVRLLEISVFLMASNPEFPKERGLLDLENLVADVTRVVSKLGDTIRKHRLFDYPSEPTLTVTKPGGVPHTTKRRLTDEEKQRRQEKFFRIFYDRFLNESIRFRDECHKALFKVEE